MSSVPARGMKVDVIGGSIAGLSAAITLLRSGADVHVHEREDTEPKDLGAGLGLNIERVGALLGDATSSLRTTTATKRIVWFAGQETVEPMALWFTTYAELRLALRAAIPDERYHAPVALSEIVDTSLTAEVTLSPGGRSVSDLLVCADGRASGARAFFAQGRPTAPAFAGYVLLRALIPEDRLSEGLRTRMMSQTLHLAVAGRYQMVAYPVPGGRLNWNWYYGVAERDLPRLLLDKDGVQQAGTLPAGTLSSETLERAREGLSAWTGWPLALATDALASDAVALHPIFEYASPRMANGAACLVGDAAHQASPITGAGAQLAMLDALALGEAAREAGPNGEAVASRLERARLAESAAVVSSGHSRGARFRLEAWD